MITPTFQKLSIKILTIAVAGYFAIAPALAADVIGKFPTLKESDGARAKDTSTVWLGELSDKENNSKQVDQDIDDGISADFKSCVKSPVTFLVHIKDPGKTSGIAYLNLFADWNRDGEWAGSDTCAPEWALKNYPIDLSLQSSDIQPYIVLVPTGKSPKEIWYRTVVSLNQMMTRADGGGELNSGEVEDYGPTPILPNAKNTTGGGRPKIKDYSLSCAPQPIALNHGQSREFTIGRAFVGSEKPVSTGFGSKNEGLSSNGTSIHTEDKDVTKKPKNPNSFGDPANPFVYTSTHVHGIGATVRDSVAVTGTYADGHVTEVTCTVFVWHPPGELPGGGGVPPSAPDEDTDFVPQGPNPIIELWKKVKDKTVEVGGGVLGWVKKTGGSIVDGLTPGGKQQNIIPLPIPNIQTPGNANIAAKPVHSEKESGLEEPVGDKIFNVTQLPVPETESLNAFQKFWNAVKQIPGDVGEVFFPPISPENVTTPASTNGLPPAPPKPINITPAGITYSQPPQPTPPTVGPISSGGVFQRLWNVVVQLGSGAGEVFFPPISPENVTTPASTNGLPPAPPKPINITPPGITYSQPPQPESPTADPLPGNSVFQKIVDLSLPVNNFFNQLVGVTGNQVQSLYRVGLEAGDVVSGYVQTPVSKFKETYNELIPSKKDKDGNIVPSHSVVIVLPAQEKVLTLPSPGFTGISGGSLPSYLSQRLIDLSKSLQGLISKPSAPNIAVSNPRCYVAVKEDANQQNIYKAEAACKGYTGCSLAIRDLSQNGVLVSSKVNNKFSGESSFTATVPNSAAISMLDITCDTTTYTAIAHNYRIGANLTTTSPLGDGPTITSSVLPGGTTNIAYSKTLSAMGGTLPYTWSVYSGSLPTGLSLAAATGIISGTPTVAGGYSFSIVATGGDGRPSSNVNTSITITSGSTPLSITTTSPLATAHINCTAVPVFAATGGTSPYTWSVSGLNAVAQANLVAVNSNSGQQSCTVFQNGTGSFTITVTDALSDTANLVVSQQELTF